MRSRGSFAPLGDYLFPVRNDSLFSRVEAFKDAFGFHYAEDDPPGVRALAACVQRP